jgi:hypothetical protein
MVNNDTTPSTKPVSRRQRFEILRRDGYTCRYCGAQAPDVPLTVDHVIPRALGGATDPTNLVTACKDCNSGKTSTSPDEHIVADVDAAAMLFARAIEKAAELRRAERDAMVECIERFDDDWMSWGYDIPGGRHTIPRDRNWQQSVERWLELGLNNEDLWSLMAVAMTGPAPEREIWKYFCGCCWREIGTRQEVARQLVEDGAV